MPAPLYRNVSISAAEVRRIAAVLKELEEYTAAGGRGASLRSVARVALTKVGREARKDIRSSTPVRTGTLARSTSGRLERTGSRDRIWYRAGWLTERLPRFQQGLAIEHGTSRIAPRKVILAALERTVGANGARLRAEYLREFHNRAQALARRANAGRRRR